MRFSRSPLAIAATLLVAVPAAGQAVKPAAAAGAPTTAAAASPSGFRGEFLGQFNSSMSKFVALAKAMPAERFAWRPAEGTMPVALVYAHVAHYNFQYPTSAMGVATPAGMRLDTLEQVAEKAQVVALLERSARFVNEEVGRMSDEQLARPTKLYGREVPQWAVLFQLLAHMNEHLGQSIAYARSNQVTPPWSK